MSNASKKSPALSPDLLSAVQHVEVNRAGWWSRGVVRLVETILWVEAGPLPLDQLAVRLRDQFDIRVSTDGLRRILAESGGRRSVVALPGGSHFKLAEAAVDRLEREASEADEDEAAARAVFGALLTKNCPELEPGDYWVRFVEGLLAPLFREIGAGTYRLLSGEAPVYAVGSVNRFVESVPQEVRDRFRECLRLFMSSADRATRRHLLRCLNAFLFLESGRLPRTALERLSSLPDSPSNYVLIFDTNALFSALDLHDNPSNSAVRSLQDLVEESKGILSVKQLVLPMTIEEARNALQNAREACGGIRALPNLSRVAIGLHHVSGITTRFLQRASSTPRPISAADYFAPYLRSMLAVIRQHGLEPHNIDVKELEEREEVLADVRNQESYWVWKGQPRPRMQILHDVMMWHYCSMQRENSPASKERAQWWVVTVDFSLLSFDRWKTRRGRHAADGGRVPTCIHPVNLVQMLGFWLPRSERYDDAVVEALRLPFYFEPFDSQAERVTLRIIDVLSRFEDVGDLSEETIASIVLDDGIRLRIGNGVPDDVQEDLIRDAIVARAATAEEEAGAAKLAKEEAQTAAQVARSEREEAVANAQRLETSLQSAQAEAAHKDELLKLAQCRLAERDRQAAVERMRRAYLWQGLAAPTAVGAALAVVVLLVGWEDGWVRAGLVALWAWIAVFSLLSTAVSSRLGGDPALNRTTVYRRVARGLKWLWLVVAGAVVIELFQRGLASLAERF